jgi:hypothetical protein
MDVTDETFPQAELHSYEAAVEDMEYKTAFAQVPRDTAALTKNSEPLGDITTRKRARDIFEDVAASKIVPDTALPSPNSLTEAPRPPSNISRTQALTATLQTLQTERRVLLRQIAEILSSSIPSSAPTEPQMETPVARYLPSIHAHSLPAPPLMASEEVEISNQAQVVIKKHIKLLHRYNEIRDVGMGLIGIVADSRGVRIRDCQEDFGVEDGD